MQITGQAKQQLEELFKQNHASGVRVAFAGMGCCSPKIGLSLDEPEEDDVIDVVNGIRVAIENRVVPQTVQVTLDYQTTPTESGFVLRGSSSCC
ncbi:hypothetical protein [Alicyclobacillus ferrooxydans]|uniref:Adhesin n=1 Tax=Alicyclobacillus ferrooxydans TaxID=471514 RepID=A0A0P9CH36_9BACL|nr:hypothetical protein [Alicyclobacillus ferrooxydans]KPV45066.1 hypothetical protein AN477_04175 [Alicyclobacillus ferrooxydans]